jgi:flavin reductase (DIM6/NTAB) family NADH-FMN oxidoreductase RutF
MDALFEPRTFVAFALAAAAASRVEAPLVAECCASLECRVVDTRFVNRHSLFVLEVVRVWHDRKARKPQTLHHLGHETFMVAGRRITLPSRMP